MSRTRAFLRRCACAADASRAPCRCSHAPPAAPLATRPGDVVERDADALAEAALARAPALRAVRPAPRAGSGAGPGPLHPGPGAPLPPDVLEDFGGRFGHDFARVRVHAGPEAGRAADAMGADAYAAGSDLVFSSGRYAPGTPAGRRLLAHELAHVVQHETGRVQGPPVRRRLRVDTPAAAFNPTGLRIPPPGSPRHAEVVQGWLNEICPEGAWVVDAASGVASSGNASFCRAPPARRPTRHRLSCDCLCSLVTSRTPDVLIHVGDEFRLSTGSTVNARVGGVTVNAGRRRHVGITGRAGTAPAVGSSAPVGSSGRYQGVEEPPWLILAHELCGHARRGQREDASTQDWSHAAGTENRIRREHSSPGAALGDVLGYFLTGSPPRVRLGARYVLGPGETFDQAMRRLGFRGDLWVGHVFDARRSPVPLDPRVTGRMRAGTWLYVEDAHWHEVAPGQTFASIASAYGRTEAALRAANPSVPAGAEPAPGQRILVPVP